LGARGGSRQGQEAKAGKAGKAERNNRLHVILRGRRSLPATPPGLNVTKRRTRQGRDATPIAIQIRNLAASWSDYAKIQGKPASGPLYLNKLLHPGGDASLAILTYHIERAIYSVQ